MRPALLVLTLSILTLSLPARADGLDAAEKAMERIAARMFSEQNIGLLFGMLRQGLAAGAEGRAAPELPAETAAKLESAAKEMQREMSGAALLLIDDMEKELRDSLREESRI